MLRLSNDIQKNEKNFQCSSLKKQYLNISLPSSLKEKKLNYMRSTFPTIISLPIKLKSNEENESEYKVYIF